MKDIALLNIQKVFPYISLILIDILIFGIKMINKLHQQCYVLEPGWGLKYCRSLKSRLRNHRGMLDYGPSFLLQALLTAWGMWEFSVAVW